MNKDKKLSVRPPLKWAGGKRWLVPKVSELYRLHGSSRRLVEPFSGGLSIALGLSPKDALLNDCNVELINFYQELKRGLVIKLRLENSRQLFNRYRSRFNLLSKAQDKKSRSLRAALFYYLNRTGFNGLCRFNSRGEFNVPFGRYRTINYQRDFSNYKQQFKGWKFTCGDFERIQIRSNDFIYVDPPYDVQFTKYSQSDFKWEDQVRLAEWLSKQSCPIVASNQATPRIVKLYRKHGFKVTKLPAPRRISCTGDRTPAMEMLATKNLT